MDKTYVIGDIHGVYEKLLNCLSQVNFNYEKDKLIQLGDVCDRGLNTFECVEELLKIKNLISIKGNHDECFFNGVITGTQMLMTQGAKESLESYIENCNLQRTIYNFKLSDMPKSHIKFWENQIPYYIDNSNNCFVHGGFNRHHLIEDTEKYGDISDLWWDRDLLASARSYSTTINNDHPFKMKNNFRTVFVGHTPTQYFGYSKPMKFANIWNLDTGCGKYGGSFGPLTIMNVETEEYWQAK